MKTPRNLILEHHQNSEPDLKAISADMLAELAENTGGFRNFSESRRTTLVNLLWAEVVAPWRRIWMSLGAAWMVILVLNTLNSETTSPTIKAMATATPETLRILDEQHQLMAQLLGPMETPAISIRTGNRPRSERREDYATA